MSTTKLATCLALVILTLITSSTASAKVKDTTPTKYLIFREDCYEAFFTRFDFTSDQTCIKFTLSKTIGYAIVTFSTIYKLPQIQKLMSSGSAAGISSFGYYFETIGFMQTLGLSRHKGLDFSIYGDTIFILFQNAVVILLIWTYNKDISIVEKILAGAFLTGYCVVLV